MHGVRCGSPNHLAFFIQSLNENKHLAMDFWAFVAFFNDHSGPLTPETINARLLDLITNAISGHSAVELIAMSGNERHLVSDLAGLLRGEDVSHPSQPVPSVAAAPVSSQPVPASQPVTATTTAEMEKLKADLKDIRIALEARFGPIRNGAFITTPENPSFSLFVRPASPPPQEPVRSNLPVAPPEPHPPSETQSLVVDRTKRLIDANPQIRAAEDPDKGRRKPMFQNFANYRTYNQKPEPEVIKPRTNTRFIFLFILTLMLVTGASTLLAANAGLLPFNLHFVSSTPAAPLSTPPQDSAIPAQGHPDPKLTPDSKLTKGRPSRQKH
jgi:hypothetical protein